MEDEARKRNTDCVYFLASPLTCKKGTECEYRHSESARLNPRDCWYWLNKTCLNPSCAFRHPPLEGLLESVPESTQLPSNTAITPSKANVPCYFYFNTYCIKGDQCPFLHEVLPAQKLPKADHDANSTHHPAENKASTGSDTGPASVEVPGNPPEDTAELIKEENPKEVVQQLAPGVALEEHSPFGESSVPDCEEPGIKLPEENLHPHTEYMNDSPELCADDGSDENAKDCVEADEWWESSPGFDVLVDDGSERLAYEEDGDYRLVQETESEMLRSCLVQYDYEVPPGYDSLAYPDAGFLYEHGAYDSYDHAENRRTPEYFRKASELSGETRNRGPTSQRRRKPSRRRHEMVGDRDVVDLRDHLRKRRRIDVSPHKCYSSRTRESCRECSQEGPERQWRGRLFHDRLASELGNNTHISLQSESEFALSDSHGRHWSGYPQSNRHTRLRLEEREHRRRNRKASQVISSEISHGFDSRRAESSLLKSADGTFSGPKTLAQIKEERRRARETEGNRSASRINQDSRGPGPRDFEGPKPLNELLKDKRISSSANDNTNGSSGMASGNEHRPSGDEELLNSGTLEKHNNGYESDFIVDDDDGEDEDTVHAKLRHMFSS